MPDNTPSSAPRVFTPHSLHYVNDAIHIVGSNGIALTPLMGDPSKMITPSDSTVVVHVADPKTDLWGERMYETLRRVNLAMLSQERKLLELKTWAEGLKQAILEEANEKDWCDEYDEFAEKWGLIPRMKEYEVRITFRVEERNEEAAMEYVLEHGLSSLDYYDISASL